MSYRGGFSSEEGTEGFMFVPIRDCGKIIGRGGSKIRELQDMCGCRIKVSRDDEGDGTRRVELSGPYDAIEKAKDEIQQILDGGDDRGARTMTEQQSYGGCPGEIMEVPSSFVGRIIGKGGSRIRELEHDTGCQIKVSREVRSRDGKSCDHTDVELIGSRSQIQRAREAIRDLMNQLY